MEVYLGSGCVGCRVVDAEKRICWGRGSWGGGEAKVGRGGGMGMERVCGGGEEGEANGLGAGGSRVGGR